MNLFLVFYFLLKLTFCPHFLFYLPNLSIWFLGLTVQQPHLSCPPRLPLLFAITKPNVVNIFQMLFSFFFSVFLSLYPSLLLLLFRLPFCTYLSVNSRLSLRNSSSFCCLSSVFYFHTQSSFSFASNHFLLLFFPPFCYLQHCNLILPPFKLSACS